MLLFLPLGSSDHLELITDVGQRLEQGFRVVVEEVRIRHVKITDCLSTDLCERLHGKQIGCVHVVLRKRLTGVKDAPDAAIFV